MMTARKMLGPALIAIPILAFITVASTRYPGSAATCQVFNLSFLILVALAAPRPRSYAYSFFTVLLALGFWFKFNVHMFFQYAFIEPIGKFDGSGSSWDRALILSSAAAWGCCIPRVCQIWHQRNALSPAQVVSSVPRWFAVWRKWVWCGTLLGIAALGVWNFDAAIYQIGVNPRTALPRLVSIPAAWLINIGFALWVATLTYWEQSLHPANLRFALLAPIFEAFTFSVSALSRAIYLLHTVPITVVMMASGWRLGKRTLAVHVALFLLTFSLSIVAVQYTRLHYFSPVPVIAVASPTTLVVPAPPTAAPNTLKPPSCDQVAPELIREHVQQVLMLPVDRWVGMEGMLAVSSFDQLGGELLLRALHEDPGLGSEALYQKIAKPAYTPSVKFTFLTVPGVAGALAYSGSIPIVALGMALITAVMMGTEWFMDRCLGNPFATSVATLTMANLVYQFHFPYLMLVFFAQLWITIGCLALVSGKLLRRGSVPLNAVAQDPVAPVLAAESRFLASAAASR